MFAVGTNEPLGYRNHPEYVKHSFVWLPSTHQTEPFSTDESPLSAVVLRLQDEFVAGSWVVSVDLSSVRRFERDVFGLLMKKNNWVGEASPEAVAGYRDIQSSVRWPFGRSDPRWADRRVTLLLGVTGSAIAPISDLHIHQGGPIRERTTQFALTSTWMSRLAKCAGSLLYRDQSEAGQQGMVLVTLRGRDVSAAVPRSLRAIEFEGADAERVWSTSMSRYLE